MSASDDILLVNFTRLYPDILFPGKTQFDKSSVEFAFPSERIIDSVNPLTWLKAARRLNDWGAEVTAFHYWHPFFAPAYKTIASNLGASTLRLGICHNVAPHEAGGLHKRLAGLFFRRMDACLVHAPQEVEELRQNFADVIAAAAFHPLYDQFPHTDLPREEAREHLGLGMEERVLLYFGLIRPYKGVDTLLEAARLLGDVSNLRVLVVGEIYEGRELLTDAVQSAPQGMVRLIDQYIPNEDVSIYFRAADIIVLPYKSATQSGIIPIAYACERPVIATRVGGLPEAVIEGETGYIVEPDDPNQLAAAIRRYFIDLHAPSLSDGVARMRERLSWDKYTEILRKLIDDTLA